MNQDQPTMLEQQHKSISEHLDFGESDEHEGRSHQHDACGAAENVGSLDVLKGVKWKSPTSTADPLYSVTMVRKPVNSDVFDSMREQVDFHDLTKTEPQVTSRRRRIVSFAADEHLVNQQIPQPFFLDEIIDAQWYSEAEIQQIHKECEETIELVRRNKTLPKHYCKRGLESCFREGPAFLVSAHEIRNRILDLQVELWMKTEEGDVSAELAEGYCLHTTHYVVKARVMGVYDYKLAQTDADE